MFKRIQAGVQYRFRVLSKNIERAMCRFKLALNRRRVQDSGQKVSVIVPVYNVEKYLRQCLDSILNQTYKNIEVVCVNDCSTDNSLNILNEYAQKDSRVVIVDKPVNEGSSYARKTGLAMSSGKWILMVDSDDWIERNMVESLLIIAVSGGFDMTYCDYFWGLPNNSEYIPNLPKNVSHDKLQRIKTVILGRGELRCLWNKLIKRDVYEKIEFPTESSPDDNYITCQTLYYSNTIGYVPLTLYHYRFNEKSLSNDPQKAKLRYLEIKAVFERIIGFCRKMFGDDLSVFEPELSEVLALIEDDNPDKV